MHNCRKGHFLTIFIFSILLLSSCEPETETRGTSRGSDRVESHQFKMLFDKEAEYLYGDTIHLNVTSIDTAFAIRKVELFINNETEPVLTSENGEFHIPGNVLGGGEISIKTKTTFSDDTETIRYKTINLLAPEVPAQRSFTLINKYPHDPESFTQGLLLKDGYVYEGTGNYGQSKIMKLDLRTGEVLKQRELSADYFGEGITIFNDKLYQLTYKSSRAFTYDANTFEPSGEFTYSTFSGEGWGLTHNDSSLIMSDGSAFIYFRDPVNFREIKRLRVFDDKGDVDRLNELEYVNGKLYANIYTEPVIAEIDPATGMVIAYLSLIGVMERNEVTANMDVLNGIAYNPATGSLLITGKYWSKIYEIRVE